MLTASIYLLSSFLAVATSQAGNPCSQRYLELYLKRMASKTPAGAVSTNTSKDTSLANVRIKPRLGTLVSDHGKLPFTVAQGSEVRALSDGKCFSGAAVYRVAAPGRRALGYKKYPSKRSAENDHSKLLLLWLVSKKPGYKGLKVTKPISLQGELLVAESPYGETLAKVLASRRYSPEVKRKLREKYLALLDHTYDALKEEIPDLERRRRWGLLSYPTDKDESGRQYRDYFFLKPDNILVETDTLDFTVFDPQ